MLEGIESRRRFWAKLLIYVGALIGWHAIAQAQDWPKKPVKIVVSFGAGGTADILGRIVASELSVALDQQFYVENKPGNSGAIGSAQVMRAEPDGYTLLIGGAGPHLVGPAVNPNIGYDTMRDFSHIAMIAGDSFMLAASPALGVKSFAELVKLARQTSVSCGSPGTGSQGHLVQELINREAGIKLQQVPYRGAADNMNDLIGNHVSLALQPTISVGEQVRAGNAVALAVTSAQRNAVFRDVPTFAELGYPKVRGTAWFWLTGPKGIDPAIVARLNLAVRQSLKSSRVQEQFATMALQTQDLDPAQLNQFLADEVALWGALAKEVALRVQ
jgi:tripartite-type tricarboxylate transporter receptor subunit TctC